MRGLTGDPNWDSEANGALMRVRPLGIFGARFAPEEVARWAERDAAITHPNPVCRQASAVFACAIAHAVRTGCTPDALYQSIVKQWSGLSHLPGAEKCHHRKLPEQQTHTVQMVGSGDIHSIEM